MSQRTITIVGAGQNGLQLGLGLQQAGYEVRMVSNRTPEDIASSRVASSQCMFATPLSYEAQVGADLWPDAPPVEGIGFTVPDPDRRGEKLFSWTARLSSPAQSVDQRVKFPALMDLFTRRDGSIEYVDAGIDELEAYARETDLVIVAAGKGEIAGLFERDDSRSTFSAPQRALALTYVHGLEPREGYEAVSFNLIPGVGEYFVFPATTLSGDCHIMVFEGTPGGPMDRFKGLTPEEHLDASLAVLRTFLPWEAERAGRVELTDSLGTLQGRFPPTIRRPVATLPSGAKILGAADVVVLNDPITGQGSNNASRCAQSYLQSIIAHGDAAFDEQFMHSTFERYWSVAKPVVDWTNALLLPPADHAFALLRGAADHPQIAHRFANGFDDPADFGSWFLDPEQGLDYLAAFDAAIPEAPINSASTMGARA
ncbi:styrene monooxygenase/indole monooxygenase family protein [Brevibacterium atlanticum]|uniref:styrene monooxygenase/indole monooxygenase family protein n=1 Tax=Brevibacterium atlanticum TaxID=2697563 RepID=UPI001422D2E7|nr:styrene monooxygenase/indole monooxygenase family protein [Brevibacterium atlanticum]